MFRFILYIPVSFILYLLMLPFGIKFHHLKYVVIEQKEYLYFYDFLDFLDFLFLKNHKYTYIEKLIRSTPKSGYEYEGKDSKVKIDKEERDRVLKTIYPTYQLLFSSIFLSAMLIIISIVIVLCNVGVNYELINVNGYNTSINTALIITGVLFVINVFNLNYIFNGNLKGHYKFTDSIFVNIQIEWAEKVQNKYDIKEEKRLKIKKTQENKKAAKREEEYRIEADATLKASHQKEQHIDSKKSIDDLLNQLDVSIKD